MDKTKTRLAAFFDNDDEESSFPSKQVDDQKLSQYAQGTARKSKREKEKEAAEAKRREEEENAARAYAEFLDAFEGEEVSKKRTGANFVKSGGSKEGQDVEVYRPSQHRVENTSRSARAIQPPSPPAEPRPKGKRAMDAFLEEIKREQADREARYSKTAAIGHGRSVTAMAAYEGQSGSKDRGDPETSNVFVANLPPHVTEQSLGIFFARAGPVGSVKIMWPRGDTGQGPGADMTSSRRTKNAGLSGFVSYMKRRDAEEALREFDGFEWGGSVLRVGWSKAVPVAAKPMFGRHKRRHYDSRSRSPSRSRSRSDSRDRYHHRSSRHSRSRSYSPARSPSPRGRPRHTGSRSRSRSRSWSRSRSHDRRRSRSYERRRSRSPRRHARSPSNEDDVTDTFIRTVAAEVKGHGKKYEESLKEREKGNAKYRFLTNPNHRRHRYYKSLVEREPNDELQFDDEGYNSIYSTDSAEESERERTRKTKLGRLARKRFEAMLRGLSGTRGELARCMAFSLEHAEAANEVSDIIISTLIVDSTPVPRKLARLHLICDILHNSAAPLPMAWKFRQEFQSRLGLVFDHFSTIYHSFPGRITAETFKKQITGVVDVWEDWIVFSPDFTRELRARLEGQVEQDEKDGNVAEEKGVVAEGMEEKAPAFGSKFKASSFRPAEAVVEPAVVPVAPDDGEPMDEGSDIDGKPVEDDVDGQPLTEDVDGEPMVEGDVDGEPMAVEEDVDGEPLDDDIDGAPIE
ncbi:uncharacterized protein STEHIDRAFT_67204 [Stereum hirsutum FP-91666 SS1]|uniref:uncharacterized protein n=1 Tax=Stereum hirsutum (strain FP-91666) TaxID=721885 RepID=UPI000444A32A|nr:uncharacterized protein STEHIDRAFT_67204 [Stereum hirsutum FP-91666 SS1]EIM81231.1 hypothetical protein STEHIDRAFT_67204 [Stereum hirsutum FP-91666 SS1]